MLYGWIKLFFLYVRTRQISFPYPSVEFSPTTTPSKEMTLVGRRGGLSLFLLSMMVLHNLLWSSYICTIKSNTNATYKLLALQPRYLSGFYSLPFQNVPSHKFSLLTIFPHLPVFPLPAPTQCVYTYISWSNIFWLFLAEFCVSRFVSHVPWCIQGTL